MGLGKTFVGSEKAMSFDEPVILVVCQKSKIHDWIQHFFKNYEDIGINDLTIKNGIELFFRDMETYPHAHYVGVINYELLWRRKGLIQALNTYDFTMMLDESSIIQNQGANWTKKGVLKLQPDNVILLSGTPVGGKYENLWTQIHLLGWKISEEVYNRQYVNWKTIKEDGFKHKIVDKDDPYKNVDRLKSKMREHGAVFMKTEECFDLPEQTFIQSLVPSTKEYKKFIKDCIITIDTLNLCEFHDDSDFYGKDVTPRIELVGDTLLTKMLYARQLCSQYNPGKVKAFKELVESTQDRLIVFYNFNEELMVMQKILKNLNRPMSIINGQTKDLTAYETESNSVTLVQYQAGAKGLNLQKANKIIYFSLTLSSEDFEQSKKRIHRIGQDRPCFYYILLCRNTIEEQILATLEERKDFTDELFRERG